MKNQGIIYYGSDNESLLDTAFQTILDYLANADMDKDTLSKYILSNTYPNFLHLKKSPEENEISIDESRNIINFLLQKPSLKANRAVLIENFEEMSRNAANSILKILEEPPADSIIVLTTTKFFSILPTIRSRCLKFRVKTERRSNIRNCSTSLEFTKNTLKEIDAQLIEKFDNFLNSGCSGVIAFAKEHSANFIEFIKVAITLCAFKSMGGNLNYSKKLLALQEFYNLAESTYPDKQAAIVAACEIFLAT